MGQQPRKPAGTPVGGQFAPTAYDEDDIDLFPVRRNLESGSQEEPGGPVAVQKTSYCALSVASRVLLTTMALLIIRVTIALMGSTTTLMPTTLLCRRPVREKRPVVHARVLPPR
jgi:hypothetical protein